MNKKIGESDRFPCITNETTTDPKHYCSGSMVGVYGGEYCEECRCGGRVIVSQYLNCTCNKCKTVAAEIFEFCCNSCSNYGLSDHFTVKDPENDCSYSWSGISYPLVEVDDVEKLKNRAVMLMQQKLSHTENYFGN